MTAPATARGRTAGQLLRDRAFGPFVAGKVLSSCGNWIQQIAAVVLMFELTRSAFMVGMASVLLFAGPLVLALWIGVLVDRYDRRLLLMIGRVISGLAVGLLAIALAAFGVDGFGGPTVLLVTAAVMGVGHALSAPAMHALTPALVPDEDLEQALAFSSAAPSIARTVGPAVGAGLLLLGGPALAFGFAALTHWLYVAILAAISARPQQREATAPRILGGLRYLLTARAAGILLLAIALLGFGADPVLTLAPALADQLGGGEQLVGLFVSVFGAGAVVVVVLFRTLRRVLALRTVGVAGFLTVVIGLAIVALAPSATGATVGFLINGAGFMMATVALNSRIQRHVPDPLRGRVMALWGVAFLGSRTIAAPFNGAMADLLSVTAAILIAAAVSLAATTLALARYRGSPADAR
jgi:MFS family permease